MPAGHARKRPLRRCFAVAVLTLLATLCATQAFAEDGYDLWLRYRPLGSAQAETYRDHASQLIVGAATPTQTATRQELLRGLGGLLGHAPPLSDNVTHDGAIVAGTPASSR